MSVNFQIPEDVGGAAELNAWFGYWPTFHDAEVLSLILERNGPSRLRVHTWHRTNQVDDHGYYVLTKHIVVCFVLDKVTDCDLGAFNHQNVVNSLSVEHDAESYRLILEPCFGLNGSIKAESLHIELEHI
jgi:immunity protein 50 of polymorphic toxin system